jgi:hypothetical protein
MLTRWVNIEHKNILGESHLYYELLAGAPLSICGHQQTCINISQDSYLLAPERSRMLVVFSVGVQLQEAYYGSNICYWSLCIYQELELYFVNVSILYPVSLVVCVFDVCLLVLSCCKFFHKLLQSYHLGLQRCYFSNPSRLKLQEMDTGNFQMEQIRRSIRYIAYKFLSLRGR